MNDTTSMPMLSKISRTHGLSTLSKHDRLLFTRFAHITRLFAIHYRRINAHVMLIKDLSGGWETKNLTENSATTLAKAEIVHA